VDKRHRILLRCPVCVRDAALRAEVSNPGWLTEEREGWRVCLYIDCGRKYPIVDRVPVMLREEGDKWRDVSVDELPNPDEVG